MNMANFLNMGGYGLYVWGAFGVSALAMVAELASLRTRRRALHQRKTERDAMQLDFARGDA